MEYKFCDQALLLVAGSVAHLMVE